MDSFIKLCFFVPALYLANLLEKDECSKDDLEVGSNPAIPSIFTEACTNENYIEVNDRFNISICRQSPR